jgi:hypothetical protein
MKNMGIWVGSVRTGLKEESNNKFKEKGIRAARCIRVER